MLDAEVLATLQDDVFRPAVIEEAIRLALEELSPAQAGEDAGSSRPNGAARALECERLADAIEQGGPIADAARAPPGGAGRGSTALEGR